MSLLDMKQIIKSFNGVEVLHGIDFSLRAGTVHALMGENGAGKSTLMKVLAGVHKCDDGEIWLKGKKTEIQSPRHAQELGIAMIHQELSPVPEMTVAENIFLGREPRKGLFVDYKKMYTDTEKLLGEMKVRVSPRAKIGRLKVADQQLIEISKAISLNADIIVMDEPTSALDPISTSKIEDLAMELKDKYTIVIVTHNMQQAARISDKTAFFLLGEVVEYNNTGDLFANPRDERTESYITGRFG